VTDVLPERPTEPRDRRPHPVAAGKWLTASITHDAATVIAEGFAEATRRDPQHRRTWVALVDGNTHQIDRIRAEARRHKVTVTMVIDLIHVIEYVWKAAWCFHPGGDPAAETWVRTQVSKILQGQAGIAALAARAPSLQSALLAAKTAGHDHIIIDGTLIETDRCRAPGPTPGVDLWWSGKHHQHGGNIRSSPRRTGGRCGPPGYGQAANTTPPPWAFTQRSCHCSPRGPTTTSPRWATWVMKANPTSSPCR
jgi:hypothetical protein